MGENWGLNRPAVCEMCVVVVADGEKAESETQRALIAELAKLCLRQSVLLCRRCYIATKFKLVFRRKNTTLEPVFGLSLLDYSRKRVVQHGASVGRGPTTDVDTKGSF